MLTVGKFAIVGDWDDTPAPDGLLRITMPPIGNVCGCGWEPYTQAALLALPDFITPGCSFADIGAGSGILCVAAKLLGAGKCYAVEINPQALEAAPRVFAANGVEAELSETLPKEHVDLAIVSISVGFVQDHHHEIHAENLLFVTDDFRVEKWS